MLDLLSFTLPLAAVLLLGYFFYQMLGIRQAFTPLIANSSILLFMLLLGGMGFLHEARLVGYVAILLLGGYAVGKNPRGFFGYLASPGVLAFLVGTVLLTAVYLVHGSFYSSWDEFSHWGQSFKLTYQEEALYQLTSYRNLAHATYPHGMSVLYYFYALLAPGFSEAATFGVMGSMLTASAATLLGNTSWKKPVVSVLGCLSIPLFFILFPYSDPYINVYQDTLLGALFGAMLVLVVATDGFSKGHTFAVGVLGAVLLHVKPLGFMLALFGWIFYTIMLLNQPKRTPGKLVMHSAWVVGSVGLSYGLWKLFLQMTGFTQDKFSNPLDKDFFTLLRQAVAGENNHLAQVWERFRINFFHMPVVYNGYGTPFVMFLLLTGFGIGAGLYLWHKQKKKGPAIVLWTMPLLFAGFLFGMFYTYACVMSTQEGLLNNSYQRYLSSFMIGWCMLALAVVLYYGEGLIPKLPGVVSAGAFGVIVALLINTGMQHDVLDLANSPDKAGRTGFDHVSAQMAQYLEPDDNVWLVAQGSDAAYNFMYAYTLMPARVFYTLPSTWIPQEMPKAKLIEEIKQNQIDYILVYIIDDGFVEYYGSLFSDNLAWVQAESLPVLYKVELGKDTVSFQRVVATSL